MTMEDRASGVINTFSDFLTETQTVYEFLTVPNVTEFIYEGYSNISKVLNEIC